MTARLGQARDSVEACWLFETCFGGRSFGATEIAYQLGCWRFSSQREVTRSALNRRERSASLGEAEGLAVRCFETPEHLVEAELFCQISFAASKLCPVCVAKFCAFSTFTYSMSASKSVAGVYKFPCYSPANGSAVNHARAKTHVQLGSFTVPKI